MSQGEEEAAAETTGARATPLLSWLKKLAEIVGNRHDVKEQLAMLFEAIGIMLLGIGVASYVTSDTFGASVGIGGGTLIMGRKYWSLITNKKSAFSLMVFIAIPITVVGIEGVVKREIDNTQIELLIGVSMVFVLLALQLLVVDRQMISYCCGAFVGPLACYVVIKLCEFEIGLENDFGIMGYVIALFVGFLLAIEMPITYRMHKVRRRHEANGGNAPYAPIIDTPSMLPLTFPVGMTMGSGSALILYLIMALAHWDVGRIIGPLILAIIFYAVRPR